LIRIKVLELTANKVLIFLLDNEQGKAPPSCRIHGRQCTVIPCHFIFQVQ